VKRRKIANQIYRDLVDLRISYEARGGRAPGPNKRQKGGWSASGSPPPGRDVRKSGLLVRSVK
jgi:hypothetical protein